MTTPATNDVLAALLAALTPTEQTSENPLLVVLKELAKQQKPQIKPQVKTARDLAYEAVQEQGYGFAKGGELLVSLDTLQAAARAVRNDTVEIVDAPKTETNEKRNIVKVVAYKVDDTTLALHPLYKVQ